MHLSLVRLVNLRRFETAEFSPHGKINLIFGPNGSGKTSILEAIHLLHAGKSFRAAGFSDLVRKGEDRFALIGKLEPMGVGEGALEIRVVKQRAATAITLNGASVESASKLATLFPLLLVDSGSFGVVDGAPRLRRSLLDRALFHVEPTYLRTLRQYQRAMQQRNELLKRSAKSHEIRYWENQLVAAAAVIHHARTSCVEQLNELLKGEEVFPGLRTLVLDYKGGWREGTEFEATLERDRARDATTGVTNSGPHKAELKLRVEGRDIARTASRGQIKLIVINVVLTLAQFIRNGSNKPPIVLIDDLGSELDESSGARAMEKIAAGGLQVFITCIRRDDVRLGPYVDLARWFHVEHGAIRQRA